MRIGSAFVSTLYICSLVMSYEGTIRVMKTAVKAARMIMDRIMLVSTSFHVFLAFAIFALQRRVVSRRVVIYYYMLGVICLQDSNY